MKYTAADTMLEVAGAIPPALVGSDAWAAVRRIGEHLPAALPTAFYLECRLGAAAATPSSPVDVIVRVAATGREILAHRNPKIRLAESLDTDRTWSRLARFCDAWADDASLRGAVESLWLEFDVGVESGEPLPEELPRPSVFVGLTDPRRTDPNVLTAALLDHFCDEAPEPMREVVQAVLARRPDGATVPYLGMMVARAPAAVRIYLTGIPEPVLPDVISRVGWPGDPGELARHLHALRQPSTVSAPPIGMVHVDLLGDVLPRIGIEYPFRRPPQIRGALIEREFLDHVVELGLCTAAKRDGLVAWPGHTLTTLRHELWCSVVARRVNCIKLVHEPGCMPEMKGYLLTSWAPTSVARLPNGRTA